MGELTLVVCGAPLATRAGEVADRLRERWSVWVVVSQTRLRAAIAPVAADVREEVGPR